LARSGMGDPRSRYRRVRKSGPEHCLLRREFRPSTPDIPHFTRLYAESTRSTGYFKVWGLSVAGTRVCQPDASLGSHRLGPSTCRGGVCVRQGQAKTSSLRGQLSRSPSDSAHANRDTVDLSYVLDLPMNTILLRGINNPSSLSIGGYPLFRGGPRCSASEYSSNTGRSTPSQTPKPTTRQI